MVSVLSFIEKNEDGVMTVSKSNALRAHWKCTTWNSFIFKVIRD